MKKIPMRKCLITNVMHEKSDLIRIVKTKENKILIDNGERINGRGAYVTKDISLFNKAQFIKVLSKAFMTPIDDSLYDQLINTIKEDK